jgi:hypothetical protein
MAVFTQEWCRIEGSPIPDLEKQYEAFTQLPSSTVVFYGTPEIQLNNPTSITHGTVFKVVPISDFGYNDIKSIDTNYSAMLTQITEYDKTIDISDDENSAQYYYRPFVITQSSVIFYADSTKTTFDHYAIIYVDRFATPEVVGIIASYVGPPIPVGEAFDYYDLRVYCVYSDGNKVIMAQGFTIDPEDLIITKLKSNVITISYTSPTGTKFSTAFVIEGIKNLQGITAYYDGPNVSYGQEAARKYSVVVGQYSDGSSATVTDFSFPDGNIVSQANSGVITIYYKGFWTTVAVPTYDVSTSRLMAYYNGPNVEVGHDFNPEYCSIKIYYAASDNINAYYENIDPSLCVFSTYRIEHEGVNHVLVQYTGKLGPVSVSMIVIGIKPEITLNFIEAEYTGPEIVEGKSFSIERVICKAHYSDGSITKVKNFSISSNIVKYVGLNEFVATYKEKDTTVTTTFGVMGLAKDSTTESSYNPIYLQNNYPEATRQNNRYRGPAESYKHDSVNSMIRENIITLYKLFANIEHSFNKLVKTVDGEQCIKVKTLNTIANLEDQTKSWLTDERFSSGKYQLKEETNE